MVTVGYRLMAAIGSVYVRCIVTAANMAARARSGIGIVDIESMLLDNSGLGLMVQMTIMQKVNVVSVFDSGVSAVGSVDVAMVFVCMAHLLDPFASNRLFGKKLFSITRPALRRGRVHLQSNERYGYLLVCKKCASLVVV